ncbi:MAG TPA: UDP-N-acetylmuramate dehydrogenase [Verrucomicrobiae bacterium]|jgi:UDP-N-acetylenolpyruvoylglucosamine reductase|nr:UDP-N-acetylmuramate dehydrogenase [Verrucomicrobiae bacterium]
MTANILQMPAQREFDFAGELESSVSKAAVVRRNEPLAKRTTLRVGGPADFYVEPANEADLAAVLKLCGRRATPFFILGRGSNLLIRDGGIRGVVICLGQAAFSEIEMKGASMRCGAGAKLKNVSVEARRNGLSGVEFLEGIPGSVGGALRMNAGAMGGQIFDAIETVRLMDFNGNVSETPREKMQVAYRGCATLRDHVALGAEFKCSVSSREEIEKRMKSFSEKRWDSQPAAPSAGCIFKNPATIPAGKLMDELGLKGARVGGAVVSAEHGNFIINDGKATARDVLELIDILKAKAKAERGIDLHTEVEIVGRD